MRGDGYFSWDEGINKTLALTERVKLILRWDMFNMTNSQFQLSRIQYTQTPSSAVGVAPPLNPDFNRPTAWQTPFYARGSVRFEF